MRGWRVRSERVGGGGRGVRGWERSERVEGEE